MKRFLTIEENEDGTSTATMSFDGVNKETFVLLLSFADFANSLVPAQDQLDAVTSKMVHIPNSAETA
jgi:hypothetical protein